MHKEPSVFRTLVRYFFARFFANDVIQSNGDTVTTVVRALSIAAVPGLMLAFFLQNQYPARDVWGRIEDHYFFVLYSLLVMAGASVFEWEMLFPDRLDFLVLSPLSLLGRQMLCAKAVALGGFLGLFLVAANGFGMVVLPMVSTGDGGVHGRSVCCAFDHRGRRIAAVRAPGAHVSAGFPAGTDACGDGAGIAAGALSSIRRCAGRDAAVAGARGAMGAVVLVSGCIRTRTPRAIVCVLCGADG
jgi:hypothetical protein